MYINPDELLPQHQYWLIVDPEELGEGPSDNKQVWIMRMEAAKLAKENVNETGTWGSEQTETKEGVHVDGETREPEEH